MTSILDQLLSFLSSQRTNEVLAFVSAFATILGAAFSIWYNLQNRRRAALRAREPSAPTATEDRDQLNIQINLIKEYLLQQQQKEAINRWSNYLLSFSQYVVGAALTTSFVGDNLTPQILGVLGVVTLLSSFAQQQLRPDIRRLEAGRRVVELRQILRRAEISAAEALTTKKSDFVLQAAKGFVEELHRVQRDEWTELRRDARDF